MKLEAPPQLSDMQRALAAAAEREWPDAGDPLVTPCSESQTEDKEPLRVLAWHIPDLGGGMRRSVVSHARIIDAYAALLDGLAIDVCIVLGVRDSLGDMPEVVGSGKDAHVELRPQPGDRGPAELRRVVDALGGIWQLALPRRRSDGGILYCGGATIGVLYRGLSTPVFDLVDTTPRPALGIGDKILCASFDAPHLRDGPLVFAASPSASTQPEVPDPDLEATMSMPPVCLFAVSAARPLDGTGDLGALRAAFGARYRLPRDEGSDLHDGFWDHAIARGTGLVHNFLACNPADVDGQDEQMHWGAMASPVHPRAHDEVLGRLRDAVLICDRRREAPCRIAELRVVDLIAAQLPQLELPEPDDPALPAERGLLAAMLEDRRAARPRPSKPSPTNDLAEARAFADELSPHAPVVAQLQYRARS